MKSPPRLRNKTLAAGAILTFTVMITLLYLFYHINMQSINTVRWFENKTKTLYIFCLAFCLNIMFVRFNHSYSWSSNSQIFNGL